MNTATIWIIMILVMILSFIVQTMLKSRFAKYSKVPTTTGLTGAEVARKMLLDNGITDVQITCIPGQLTD
ncbi:MAG: zinc metallopeptidase, partial [Bacteroidales bacterium]|nr:zinc metallopeptidase [Bacteroidales bacterium]